METKILKAVFGGGTSTVTNKRTRTDYGQVLEIIGIDLPDTFECIFSNSNTSAGVGKKMIGSAQRVLIPDEYLSTGQTIYAWILLHDTEDDGRHMYSIRIPVADMPDTSPEEPTPVEQSVISQAITALNSAVTTTTQKAQEATESADRAEHAAEGAEGYAERAESAQQAAESARDIALEAKVSAQASAATASEKASEAISSATTASQSALTAESASESASASADASYQNAETAYRYAQDSATSAGQASGSAQTASSKASEASQSASIASARAIEADTAAGASIDAKNDAVTAQTAAQTAKTSAESARDEAQNIADGITGKVEQIDSNTDRIESLEDDRYKPYPHDTASGSIASFSDGADDIPLKSCIVQIEPMQSGSGDPSPDNVRPISGWTGCEVQRTGKNLIPFPFDTASGTSFGGLTVTYTDDGVITVKGTKTSSGTWTLKKIKLPAGTYTVNLNAELPSGMSLRVYHAASNTTYASARTMAVTFTLTEELELLVYILTQNSLTGNVDITFRPQVEVGDTATEYESYQGETYPITFPSEAGTIYGGYIEPINGEIVADMAMVDLGTLDWRYSSTYSVFNTASLAGVIASRKVVCSMYPRNPADASNSGVLNSGDKWITVNKGTGTSGSFSNGTVFLKDLAYTDAASFKAAMSGVMLCYELAEPIHYPLTAHQINSLYGQNNIWSDAGDVSVEYRADTKLYIEKLTQPEENDMIADSAITSGQFFMVGNTLYRALANIASGATITVGTNAQRVSLSDALNLVNA